MFDDFESPGEIIVFPLQLVNVNPTRYKGTDDIPPDVLAQWFASNFWPLIQCSFHSQGSLCVLCLCITAVGVFIYSVFTSGLDIVTCVVVYLITNGPSSLAIDLPCKVTYTYPTCT